MSRFAIDAETGDQPKTSGCTPEDFSVLFERIHAEHPDQHITHLAYSAVTTCSYQSAIIAAEELGFEQIEWVKTGCVITTHGGSGAFGAVVLAKK